MCGRCLLTVMFSCLCPWASCSIGCRLGLWPGLEALCLCVTVDSLHHRWLECHLFLIDLCGFLASPLAGMSSFSHWLIFVPLLSTPLMVFLGSVSMLYIQVFWPVCFSFSQYLPVAGILRPVPANNWLSVPLPPSCFGSQDYPASHTSFKNHLWISAEKYHWDNCWDCIKTINTFTGNWELSDSHSTHL